jgi:hypothetical protein
MHKLREHIGLDNRFDDDPWTIIVRSKLFGYACTYGDSKCRANATTKLLAYMKDPVANKWVLSRKATNCFMRDFKNFISSN